MRKIYLILFLMLCLKQDINAQVFEKKFNWNLSTTQFAQVTACAPRSNGNNLIAIRQSYQTGQGAAALIELTPNGDTIWSKKFNRGGTTYGENFISFIEELPNHGIFMAGYTHSSSGYYHAALWLADSIGNITLYKQFAYNTYREITINDIDVDTDGSIYFAGNYFDLFSGGVSYYTWTVPLYGKLNPDLTLAWGKTWGDTNHSNNNNNRGNVLGIKIAPDNNVVVLGSDAVDFSSGYLGTLQLAKVTSGGVTIWSKQRNLISNSYIQSLVLGNSGEIYAITQLANGTVNGNNHIIEKFTANGIPMWAKEFGSAFSESITRAKFNPYNNCIVLIGNYQNSPNPYMALQTTIDTSGTPIQAKIYGEIVSSYNYFVDVACLPNNYMFAGNSYTFGGLLVQTGHDGNTGCTASNITIQSLNYTTNPYSQGIYHGGMSFTITDNNTNYINNPITFSQTCYTCSNVTITSNISACNSYYVGGALQFTSGYYYDTLVSVGGCDSIMATNLTIFQNPSTADAGINQNVCNNSTSINANTPNIGTGVWTVISGGGNIVNVNDPTTGVNNLSLGNNTLRWTISNGSCNNNYDEVNIFVGTPSAATIYENGCDSVTVNSISYYSDGIYNQTLQNMAGCDSSLTINVSIVNSSTYDVNENACNSYSLNAQTYTTSGTYYQVLQNLAGCDSLITINLSINYSNDTLLNVSTCNEDFMINNQTYTVTGTYTQTLQTLAGCDSVITIELIINPAVDTTIIVNSITLSSNQTNAQFQWLDCNTNSAILSATNFDYTPIINGNYAVVINSNGCIDTSACYGIYTVEIDEQQVNLNTFELLPNPNDGVFNIKCNFLNAKLEITTIQGAIVYENMLMESMNTIELQLLPEGIYFVRLSNSASNISKKILIKK